MDARLETSLAPASPSARELVIAREIKAPRERVFRAWTDPEQVRYWFGCDQTTFVSCEMDLRVHGPYRMVTATPDGTEHTLAGFYCEITPPERLVYTETYFGPAFDSNEALITVTFAARSGGRTLVTVTILHRTPEDCARRKAFGFESGIQQSLDRLERHLQSLAATV